MPSQRLKGLANGKLGGPEKPLMCGLGSKIGLTVESEEGEVPHLLRGFKGLKAGKRQARMP